ncbi:MAG: cation:proton antiporter [Xenococcaceae cyanobacterium]
MTHPQQLLPILILLMGAIVVLAILLKSGLEQIGIPPLVGYLLLGLSLSFIDREWNLLSPVGREIFEFLADIGIISLLFRVGLESKLAKLMRQLRQASVIWAGNVFTSGLLGFLVASSLLKLELIPSLFIGIAMTATSVGISVSVWREAKAINSPNGELMLDVAEMDDISAVMFMALLFAVVPVLHNGTESNLLPLMAKTAGIFFLKAIFFAAFCFFFSRYAEPYLTRFFRQLDPPSDFTLMVVGIGFFIAALAGLLGFSEAIGAFFAGLVFSRDPQAVKIDASFDILYELFVPFFFIGIGLKMDPANLLTGLDLGGILLIVAVLGKVIGAAVPAIIAAGWTGAILIGISMVPRAEIMMVVMQKGLHLGEWAVPSQVFAAMVVVSAVTSIAIPLVLRPLLQHWPQR